MLPLLLNVILGLAVANGQVQVLTSSAVSVAASTTVTQVMPPAATQGFDISLVSNATLFNWCLAQQNTCPEMCWGAASQNSCDPTTLQYTCVCPNGTVPDSSAFQQTVPYYVCETNYGQCINRNADQADAQAQCRTNEQCGTRNATAEAIAAKSAARGSTGISTVSSSPSSATSSYTSSTTNSMTTSSKTSQSGLSASSSATPSSSTSSSLPASAYAGIGVGATLAVITVIAITYFLFRRHRRNRGNQSVITSGSQQNTQTPSNNDYYGGSELQGDPGKGYGFVSTVQQKPEMQTPSNRHEADAPGVSVISTRPRPAGGRHELHGDTVSYQRNEESDTTVYDEKNGCDDDRWGGGPGQAASDSRSAG